MLEFLEQYRLPSMINLHSTAAELAVDIKVENELKATNANSVLESMQVLMRTPTVVNDGVIPDASDRTFRNNSCWCCGSGTKCHIFLKAIAIEITL